MTHLPHDLPPHGSPAPAAGPPDELDPASQSLADALRRSFAVLKALMLVTVAAYALSGWFRVQPGEVGFVVRMGRVAGPPAQRVLAPGWHWSFPYPVDQVITVATQRERLLPVSFMFQITSEEKIQGIRRNIQAPLSPRRDNFLITGDANILHAQMLARYRISDPVSYVTHVHDSTPEDQSPPEYELLEQALCHAAIRTAAGRRLADIFGAGQADFLAALTETARGRLAALTAAGGGLGIELVAVIAPQVIGLEAILAPRAVQGEFEQVLAAEQQKIKKTSEAEAAARSLLSQTAGPDYLELSGAIDAEFQALIDTLRASAAPNPAARPLAAANDALERRRAATDRLLLASTGEVQQIVNDARADRDRLLNEAEADYGRLQRLTPEFRRNGRFLIERLQTEFLGRVLSDDRIQKNVVSPGQSIGLDIPRNPNARAPRPAGKKPRQGMPTPSGGFAEHGMLQTPQPK